MGTNKIWYSDANSDAVRVYETVKPDANSLEINFLEAALNKAYLYGRADESDERAAKQEVLVRSKKLLIGAKFGTISFVVGLAIGPALLFIWRLLS